MKNFNKRIIITAVLAVLSSTYVLAQTTTPNIDNIEQQLKTSRPKQPLTPNSVHQQQLIEEEKQANVTVSPPAEAASTQSILVNSFKLQPMLAQLPMAELERSLAQWQGQKLTFEQLQQVADKVTEILKSKGYLLAQAYVPKQDASAGEILIEVLLGKYGELGIANESYVKNSVLRKRINKLKNFTYVNERQLYRSLLLINDLLGAGTPHLTFNSGKEPGTIDVFIQVPKDKRYSAYALFDNYGPDITGVYRLSGGASWYSPLGYGDNLSVTGVATEKAGILNGRLAYDIPVLSNGLRLGVALTGTKYSLGKEFSQLEAVGNSTALELNALYPLSRTETVNWNLTADISAKKLVDKINAFNSSSKKTATVANFALQRTGWGSLFGQQLYNSAEIKLTTASFDYQLATRQATCFALAKFNLDATLFLTEKFSLRAGVQLQKALTGKSIDGSEQLNIAGSQGVRYLKNTVSGDDGYILQTQLNYRLPEFRSIQHMTSVGLDVGGVYYNGNNVLNKEQMATDVWLGYGMQYKNLSFQLKWAQKLVTNKLQTKANNQLLMQMGINF